MGSGAMTNSFEEIFKSKVILVTGTNTTWNHPVFGSMIKQAVRQNGLKLIVADPRRIDLVDYADIWLQQKNGTDVALLMGMQHIIFRDGLEDSAYIEERLENFDEYKKSLAFFTPEKVEELTGVKKEDVEKAAVLYASNKPGALYYCMGITQHSHGVDNVKSCVNMQMVNGNVGVEGGGVNPLRGQNNVQGACDMGGLPVFYTGYQKTIDEGARKKFMEYWGKPEDFVSVGNGLPLTEMINECGEKIRVLYVLGENPMMSDPNLNHVKEQLEKLDLLIVQDIFPTPTTAMADVVLPAVSFAEKFGTITNSERRVQVSHQALQPTGDVKQDYEIFADLAEHFGDKLARTPQDLFNEIKDLTPQYHGMTLERLEECGLQWPCPNEDHPGTMFLHKGKFAKGKGDLTPMTYKPSAEEPDSDWPMRLSTGRMLQHFHTGTMTRRSDILDAIVKHGEVEVHPDDADKLGVTSGDKVKVSTRRGQIETFVNVVERVAQGSIFVPFHFEEAPANILTNDALDPIAKIPEYKVCAARLEKVS
jgi:predicted molibdopterin-dependent oxidoreductase YjgC